MKIYQIIDENNYFILLMHPILRLLSYSSLPFNKVKTIYNAKTKVFKSHLVLYICSSLLESQIAVESTD